MDPTVILSSLFILFLFGFNGGQFLGIDPLTTLDMLDRATKTICGSTMISSLSAAFGTIGTSRTPPPTPQAGHSWNESCTEIPASVYAPWVFGKPVRAKVCFPDDVVGIWDNSTETLEWPVRSSVPSRSALFESFGSHFPSSYANQDSINMKITFLCFLVPFCFLTWASLTRKPSRVDDETSVKNGYVDAAIAEISSRIPELTLLRANQQRLEGQLIGIEGVENRVNGRTDDRIYELRVLLQKQIRDIDLVSLTSRADSIQKNHELVASQVRKLQEDRPRWALLADDIKDLKTDLTIHTERETGRVQTDLNGHVDHINGRIFDIQTQNKKIVVDVEKISKEQTACNAMVDQLGALEKQVNDFVASNSRLQQQTDDIDKLKNQFEGTNDGNERLQNLQQHINSEKQRVDILEQNVVLINEKLQLLKQQEEIDIKASEEKVKAVESQIGATDDLLEKLQDREASDHQRVKVMENEVTTLRKQIRELQKQDGFDPKQVRVIESDVASLKEQIQELQEKEASDPKQVEVVKSGVASLKEQVQKLQKQEGSSLKLAKYVEGKVASLKAQVEDQEQRQANNTTNAQSQEIQTSLNQRIAKVEAELHQITVVKKEEERAHTQTLLENKIEKLNIDELRNKLQAIESFVKDDTENILHIQNNISKTKSKFESEFARTTEDTEQRINNVVEQFRIHLDDIRNTISTLQDDFKEHTPNEIMAEQIKEIQTDLVIAKDKGRSLELKVFGSSLDVAMRTRLSVMEKIDELQSQLQKLENQYKFSTKKEEIPVQKHSNIGTTASAQPSQPPQTPQTPTPPRMNASASDFVPSPRPKNSQSKEDKEKGKERAGTLSSQSSTTDGESKKTPSKSTAESNLRDLALSRWASIPSEPEQPQRNDSQSQEDEGKGKERAGTLSSQSLTTDGKSQETPAKSTTEVKTPEKKLQGLALSRWASIPSEPEQSQPNDSQSQEDEGKGKERAGTLSSQSSATNRKSQETPAKSTAKIDHFALNYRLKTLEEKEEEYQRDLERREEAMRFKEFWEEKAKEFPGGLEASRWASPEQQVSQKGPRKPKTPPRKKKGGKGSKS